VNITPENNPALVIQLLNDQIHGFEPWIGFPGFGSSLFCN